MTIENELKKGDHFKAFESKNVLWEVIFVGDRPAKNANLKNHKLGKYYIGEYKNYKRVFIDQDISEIIL